MPLHIQKRLEAYFGLLTRLTTPLKCLLTALHQGGTSSLLPRTFASWMSLEGHHFTAYENSTPVARLTPLATGLVLDVGAGWGSQVHRFDQTKVERIYGIEPNASLIPLLSKKVEECGLEGVYFPLNCGIEDVAIEQGSVDCIVCMQVLCSVRDPEVVVGQFWRLLKPGGKLIFWEHERSRDWVTGWVQRVWNWGWKPLVGGCCLDREVGRVVLGGGEWEVVEFEREDSRAEPWNMLPRVWGVLVKK